MDSDDTWAVLISRLDGRWQVAELPTVDALDLDLLLAAVHRRPGEVGSFALVDVADEFFVVVRVVMGVERVLLSDVTAAVAWDLAAQVCEHLELEPPRDDGDVDDLWPAGDLGIFDDVGLDEMELGAILSDVDAYADEMLSTIARRLGFAVDFERVVDALV